MSCVTFYQVTSSSFLFLIASLVQVVTPIGVSEASSARNRSDAQTPQLSSRRNYFPIPQKPRSKKSITRTDRWFTFKSPDGDFSLSFPSKPSPEQPNEGPITDIRTYSLTTAEGMRFSVNFNDTGGDPNARENNEWSKDAEELIASADRRAGLRVVQIHRLEKNVIETELRQSVPNTSGQINYLRRSIFTRARVYTLACGPVISGKAIDKPICLKYFASLRFTKTSPVTLKQR